MSHPPVRLDPHRSSILRPFWITRNCQRPNLISVCYGESRDFPAEYAPIDSICGGVWQNGSRAGRGLKSDHFLGKQLGFIPLFRIASLTEFDIFTFLLNSASVAQLAEQLICNQQVVGSNPSAGSLFFAKLFNDNDLGESIWVHQGGLPKRSNGTDCKSVGSAFAGSNPAPPNKILVADQFATDGNSCRFFVSAVAWRLIEGETCEKPELRWFSHWGFGSI